MATNNNDTTFDPYATYNGVVAYGVPKGRGQASVSLPSRLITSTTVAAKGVVTATGVAGKVTTAVATARALVSTEVTSTPLRTNWVAWSKIGDVSFALDLTNDAGNRPMSWAGWVYKVKPLGKNVVVYGENGVSMLYPVDSPSPTFGLQRVWSVGLLGKETVTGDDENHYFIDSEGYLVQLTQKEVKSLGYKEFLKPLGTSGYTVLMHYDSGNKRVYMCNNVVGYLLTESGLGGGPVSITGIQQRGANSTAVSPTSLTQGSAIFSSDLLDFGSREPKPLKKVVVSCSSPTDLWLSVDYRLDNNVGFRSTTWKRLNNRGEGFVNITGIEFRFKFKTLTEVEMKIDAFSVYLQMTDRALQSEVLK